MLYIIVTCIVKSHGVLQNGLQRVSFELVNYMGGLCDDDVQIDVTNIDP